MEFGSAFVLSKQVNPDVDYEEIYDINSSYGILSASGKRDRNKGETCIVDIINTAGQEEHSRIRDQCMRTAQAFMILFSIASQESFEEAIKLYEFCRSFNESPEVPVVFCANKSDLEDARAVKVEDTHAMAAKFGVPLFETSTKLRLNIDESFMKLVQITPPRIDYEYKIAILGAEGVGKSSMIIQFLQQKHFDNRYDPTTGDSYRKQMVVRGLRSMTDWKKELDTMESASVTFLLKRSSGLFISLFRKKAHRSSSRPSPSSPGYGVVNNTAIVEESSSAVRRLRKEPKKDTNIVFLDLGSLSPEKSKIHKITPLAQLPSACSNCQAFLSTSATCMFCDTSWYKLFQHHTQVRRTAEDYVLVRRSFMFTTDDMTRDTPNFEDKALVVFCIDISRSMAIAQKVNDSQNLRQSVEMRSRRSDTNNGLAAYVSRLECIQDKIRIQLNHLEKCYPERKVAIVAFHAVLECYISGVGQEPTIIDVSNIDSLKRGMGKADMFYPISEPWKSVKDSIQHLKRHVDRLETKSTSALGSALAFALGLARNYRKQHSTSAEIFVCTDGASNTGIGNTVGFYQQSSQEHGRGFYSRVGEIASGISAKVNVIGIGDEEVSLEILAIAARLSGGAVTTLQPDGLKQEIWAAAQRRVIAKDILVKVYAPKNWEFPPDPRPGVTVTGNILTYKAAQVDDETNIGFTFGIREDGHPESKSAPFQTQITYTDSSTRNVHVRILNHTVPVTADRNHAETAGEIALTGTHLLQQTAHQASQILVNNVTFNDEVKDQLVSLRYSLHAGYRLLIRATKTVIQQEELEKFSRECVQLDDELEKMSAGQWHAGDRDQASRVFAHVAVLSCNNLLAGSKIGQIRRRT